jgi:hypothetical protein
MSGVPEVTDVTLVAGEERGIVCAQCGAGTGPLTQVGEVWLHAECRRFWKPSSKDEPSPTSLFAAGNQRGGPR